MGGGRDVAGSLAKEEALFEAIHSTGEKLFGPVNLRALAEANTLQDVNALRGVQALLAVFGDAGVAPRVAFNPGTKLCSFSLSVPAVAPPWDDVRSSLLWVALGLAGTAHLRRAEERYAAWLRERGLVGGLLANACLDVFYKQSTIAFTTRTEDFANRSVRVGCVPFRETQRSDAAQKAYCWAPCYLSVTGAEPLDEADDAEADGAEPPRSREKVQLQRQRLLDDMMADLWDLVGQQRYIPDAGLVETISPALRAFLDTGVHGQTAGFTPKGAPLSLYLWGTAGIGKSEFVRVLRESTQQLLRRHVSPQHEVHVVKVLLNSLTASDMRAVANVKGISDMSIERLCEQAIGKNHLVILHFEENPEDPELQAQLYDIAKGILTSLLRRYPDKRANIMYLFTSNYPPAGPLAAELRVVHVTVPSAEKQRQWCVDRLTDTAREVGGVASLDLALDLVPPELGDMRKLRQWWQTIGFHLGRRVLGQRDGVAVSVSRDGDGSATVSVADGEASRLATHDGVFWFDAGRGRHPALDAEGAPEAQQVRLLTVLDMLRHVYLRPAVVVLTGADCGRERCLAALLTLLRAELGDRVRETDVSIREEGDKEKVFGRADEVQGGLFRFIAEANGAARAEDGLFAVVVARVNAVGQFALRELLESGDSSTHRLAVRKDRVLFVLSIDAGVELQPPLSSRAHDVIECA